MAYVDTLNLVTLGSGNVQFLRYHTGCSETYSSIHISILPQCVCNMIGHVQLPQEQRNIWFHNVIMHQLYSRIYSQEPWNLLG